MNWRKYFSPIYSRRNKVATAVLPQASSDAAYAGAGQDTVTRTSVFDFPLDPRREINYYTRKTLIQKTRWLDNNLGLVGGFHGKTASLVVGTGISHIPATRDEAWNDLAEAYFTEWASEANLCDSRGRETFWSMQERLLISLFRDGDVFCLKTPLPYEGNGRLGLPQLQWLESHAIGSQDAKPKDQVSSPYNLPFFSFGCDLDNERFREGIKLGERNRVFAYKILQDSSPDTFDLSSNIIVPASAMMHVYKSRNADSLRGVPWLKHGVNSAIDILDLTSLEKAAVKLHSALGMAIKRKSPDAGRGGLTGDLTRTIGENAQTGKRKVTAYENFVGGAAILNLALDEEAELFNSDRPSPTFTGFIDFLAQDMACGFGLPVELVWDMSGVAKGPAMRATLESALPFLRGVQDLLVDKFCKRTYLWVIARAFQRGEIPRCSDPNWQVCDWVGPSKITIDSGRDGQLELDRLANACLTWDEYWAARGKNGKKMVHKRIDEIADAMAYAEEKGVPFDYVCPLQPGAQQNQQQQLPPSL